MVAVFVRSRRSVTAGIRRKKCVCGGEEAPGVSGTVETRAGGGTGCGGTSEFRRLEPAQTTVLMPLCLDLVLLLV